ncbi:MAG TPA: DNA mismatch repair protein MutT [Cytophagales bacterium]|nr:DNA mismatch repair protein MutT [Cytophagales bacterium]
MQSDEQNPWTTKSKREVYDNPWIQVNHHEVITPSGGDGIYGVVHFKNKAIGIIPIDENGYTWLIGQYRYTLNEYSWEIPMGGSPLHQTPLEGAKRELKEETGMTADKWTEVMRIHTSNSVTDEEGFVYLAEDLTPGEMEWDDTEQLKVWHLPLSEALQLCDEGKITDAIAIAGLYRVARMRN